MSLPRGLVLAMCVAASSATAQMPALHHVGLSSVDPDRAMAWYLALWPSATRTTVADRGIATLVDVAEEPSEPNPIRRFSVLVDAIDVDLITSLARVAADHPGLLSVELRQLGGALAEEPRRPAIAGPIAAGGLITATARAHDAQAVEAAGAAFAALKDAIAGRIVRGLPVTFLANDQGLGEAYSEGDLEFLRAVRTEVNREGTIRGNRHIV